MSLIKCPECGKEISEQVKICPNCGFRVKKHNVKRIICVCVGSCAALALGLVVIFNLNSPVRKFDKALKKELYAEAIEIYENNIKSSSGDKVKVDNSLKESTEKKVAEYADGSINKGDCIEFIDFGKAIITYDWESIAEKIDKLETSKVHYDSGEKLYSQKEFIKAIKEYKEVIKEDTENYESSISKINMCESEYCSGIVSKIKEDIESKDIVEAYKKDRILVNEYEWILENPDVKQALELMRNDVKNLLVKNIQKLIDNKKYVKAITYLNQNFPPDFSDDGDIKKLQFSAKKKIVKETLEKTNKLIKQKKYEEAEQCINNNILYDVESILSKKKSEVFNLVKKQKIKEFEELKKNLSIVYDSVDDDYTVVKKGFSSEYINISHNVNIEARGTISKDGRGDFQLLVGFVQNGWIFTETVKFSSDKYKKTIGIPYSDRYTQVLDNAEIAEWMFISYIESSSSIDEIVNNIIQEDNVTIRFGADGKGTRDHTITYSEKENIRIMKKFFDMMEKYPYLKEYAV